MTVDRHALSRAFTFPSIWTIQAVSLGDARPKRGKPEARSSV